ncbi:MAG: SprT-like domain-containing protein [Pseudomonadota bacterium]
MPADSVDGFPARPGPRSIVAWIDGPVRSRAAELVTAAGGQLPDRVEVAFDLRGRMAGQARLLPDGTGLIRLNRQLFEFPEHEYAELRDTVLHEMAHLCVMCSAQRARPHGRRWRALAQALGAIPRATHALPLRGVRAGTEYGYDLGDRTVWLGSTRHARLQAGKAIYRIRTESGSRAIPRDAFTGQSRKKKD